MNKQINFICTCFVLVSIDLMVAIFLVFCS